jgi:hypothetical protein
MGIYLIIPQQDKKSNRQKPQKWQLEKLPSSETGKIHIIQYCNKIKMRLLQKVSAFFLYISMAYPP